MSPHRAARMRHGRHAVPANGFTLAEMLVSLALFAMVSAMLLAILTGEERAEAAIEGRDAGLESVIGVQTLLRGRIETMRSEPQPFNGGLSLAITGDGHSFAWPALLPIGSGPHALHYFRLALAPPHRLVLETVSSLGGVNITDPAHLGWIATPLLDNVAALEIDYFGIEPRQGAIAWQDNWQGRRTLPLLVRIRVRFTAGDPRAWPTLIVRPWPDARISCDENQHGGDCGTPS